MKPLGEKLADRTLLMRGDISSAYRARDARLGRDVFLKVLHPHLVADPDLRARFEREAQAAARIDHPQLVRIYEVGEDPHEGPYMILEWVDGESLRAMLARDGKLGPEQVFKLARALCSGLAALHGSGILHRDVKPENILCRTDGEFKLTDFSLALLADVPKLTHHTAIVGTPAYIAPEVARGKGPSERSDLFSTGVVLYEAATGTNPFDSDSLLEALRRVREVEPEWPLLEESGCSEQLVRQIRACVAKEPEERPASAYEALALLAGDALPGPSASRHKSRALPIAMAGFLLLAVVALLFWPQPESVPLTTTGETVNGRQDSLLSHLDTAARSNPLDTLRGVRPETEARAQPDTTIQTLDKPRRDSVLNKPPASSLPDSFALHIDSRPWARVAIEGFELGITPLGKPFRLPRGKHSILLRNPAYPPIQASLELTADTRATFVLDQYVQHLELRVEPWGEVFIDGETVGTTPLSRMPVVLPGSHTLRITHPNLAAVETNWEAIAGDTLVFTANLQTSALAMRAQGGRN